MFALKNLEVRGFRGFTENKKLEFDNPAVLLLGENHQGKSSTLNAIEWCLFGNDCTGTRTGIRERVDWEIPNRYLAKPDVLAHLELEDSQSRDRIHISRRWLSARKDELELVLPNGKTLVGQEAEERLAGLLRSSFKDFMSMTYQHQEAIRAVLTQESKDRNDAIDRLLGLTEYSNMLAAIDAAKVAARQKEIEGSFNEFAREIDLARKTRATMVEEKKSEATNAGLDESQLCEKAGLDIASKVKGRLEEFASQAGMKLEELGLPGTWSGLASYSQKAGGEVRRFRAEMPSINKQADLFNKRARLASVKTDYESANGKLKEAEEALADFVKLTGDEAKIGEKKSTIEKQMKRQEMELSSANKRAAAINRAIECLELEEPRTDNCPVCGKETPDLLNHLKEEWKERFEEKLGHIQERLAELENAMKETENLGRKHAELNQDVGAAKKSVGEVRKQIAEELEIEITEKDNPQVILEKQLKMVEDELEKLKQTVEAKQGILDGITDLLRQAGLISDLLELDERRKIVERIGESSEYQKLDQLRGEIAVMVADVLEIKDAVARASHDEAERKVSAAGRMIDSYFRRIAEHPAVEGVAFEVSVDARTGRNSYEFRDQDGNNLIPILSQGDLNVMALSLFLGMACCKEIEQPFGFVMLDDPSQSMGTAHKSKLAEVLNEVLAGKTVVLSTMDKELEDFVLSNVEKNVTKYEFTSWTPEKGPQIKKANP